MKILQPFKMYAEFEDEYYSYFSGMDEDCCMSSIASAQSVHGPVKMYTGVTDDYYIDGELREEI